MKSPSRRQLARYAVDQLLLGTRPKVVAGQLGASLAAAGKLSQAELLISDISWELEHRGKLATVTVTSATALTDQLRREIAVFVKKALRVEQTEIEHKLDPSVIGGVRIDSASRSWDKTILKELTNIREAF